MPANPKYDPGLRETVWKAYESEGSVRKGATSVGLSYARFYVLLKETKEGRALLRNTPRSKASRRRK